ncbi:MAG TPA: D-glucuronyl C5-epimerase family protein [Candidatus Limnocylindrales bacterium]|nr:D-glucuronyl C5-epimerase family protein [Candidatus Limnocylindrales bacterium]
MASGLRHSIRGAYPIDPLADGGASGPYPIDWRPHYPFAGGHEVRRTRSYDGSEFHNPVTIGLYALARHANLCRGVQPTEERAFLAHADHLAETQDSRGGWAYPIPSPRYGLGPGWYSGMAQGIAASVLFRAGRYRGSAEYTSLGLLALDLMLEDTDRGGCTIYDRSMVRFIEEYPSTPPSLVLNGAVFAIIGLVEGHSVDDDRVQQAAEGLGSLVPRYDLGYWSAYDLRYSTPASYAYHMLHVSLLRVLGGIVDAPNLTAFADRWALQAAQPAGRLRALLGRSGQALRRGW